MWSNCPSIKVKILDSFDFIPNSSNTGNMSKFKKGVFHIGSILLIIALLTLTTVMFGKNIHATINTTAWIFGINLNNIQNDSYVNWIKEQGNNLQTNQSGIFLNKSIVFKDQVATNTTPILGQQTAAGEKWIEVDISDQKLYMKEGNTTVGNFLVSTGKWYPTPTGEWRIWTKLRYTRMKGG